MHPHKLVRLPAVVALAVSLLAGTTGLVTAGAFTAGALTRISDASPFASCTADNVAGQPGTNYLNSEVEPWVDVNPTAASNIVAGYQQDRWSNGGSRGLVASVTKDGGLTWQRVVIPKITVCSGGTAANGGDYKRATDPWLSFAPNGHLYFMSLALDIETPPNRTGGFGKNAMLISKSTDGGLTWSDPITLIKDTDPQILNDKNSITADPGDSNFVYAVWDRVELPLGTVINPENVIGLGFRGPAFFSRTTDGGQTWEPARSIYNPGGNNQTLAHQIAVLPNGTLLDVFTEFLNFRNDDGGSHFDASLSVIRSTDKGATWSRGPANRAAKELFRGARNPDTGRPIRAEGGIPDVAVDRHPGSPGYGNVYAVWQDLRFRGVDEIAFSRSTDGGNTWSTPIRVNKTPANANPLNQQAFVPSVHVAADGTIGVTYYDFRNNTSASGVPTDYWIVHCHRSSTTSCTSAADWGNEVRLTDGSFDIEQAPAARGPFGFFVGDYQGLASMGNQFLPVFVLVNNGNTGNRTDVFARRVGP